MEARLRVRGSGGAGREDGLRLPPEPWVRRVVAHGDWPSLKEVRVQVLTRLRHIAQGLTEPMAAGETARAAPSTFKEMKQQ